MSQWSKSPLPLKLSSLAWMPDKQMHCEHCIEYELSSILKFDWHNHFAWLTFLSFVFFCQDNEQYYARCCEENKKQGPIFVNLGLYYVNIYIGSIAWVCYLNCCSHRYLCCEENKRERSNFCLPGPPFSASSLHPAPEKCPRVQIRIYLFASTAIVEVAKQETIFEGISPKFPTQNWKRPRTRPRPEAGF